MLDFGKIIIYTSNLRIVRSPQRKHEVLRHHAAPAVDLDGYPKARERGGRRRTKTLCVQEGEEKLMGDAEAKVMVLGEIILAGVVFMTQFLFLGVLNLTMSPALSLSMRLRSLPLDSFFAF